MFVQELHTWESIDDIDWGIIEANLLEFAKNRLAAFSEKYPEQKIYGIAGRSGQNWDFDLCMNTESGLAGQPGIFRKLNPQSPMSKEPDEQLQRNLGKWSFNHWQWGLGSEGFGVPDPSFSVHEKVLSSLFEKADEIAEEADDDEEMERIGQVGQEFQSACARATARLEHSEEFARLNVTDDFELRVYQEYDHDPSVIEKARAEIDSGNCPPQPEEMADCGNDALYVPSAPKKWTAMSAKDLLDVFWGPAMGDGDEVTLLCAESGEAPESETEVLVLAKEDRLFVRFYCWDNDIWGTMTNRDDPVYKEEAVEVFIAQGSEDPMNYFQFAVSPSGVLFDAKISNPDGTNATMHREPAWDCDGIDWAAAMGKEENLRAFGDWSAVLVIPLNALPGDVDHPLEPKTWRANFCRIERPRDKEQEFTAWKPAMTSPANFHTPRDFGILQLS